MQLCKYEGSDLPLLTKSTGICRMFHLPSWFHVCNGRANWKWALGYFCEGLCTFNSPHLDSSFYYSPKKPTHSFLIY